MVGKGVPFCEVSSVQGSGIETVHTPNTQLICIMLGSNSGADTENCQLRSENESSDSATVSLDS